MIYTSEYPAPKSVQISPGCQISSSAIVNHRVGGSTFPICLKTGVKVGDGCKIGGGVILGPGVTLHTHVRLTDTTVGTKTTIHANSSVIDAINPSRKNKTIIGKNCVIFGDVVIGTNSKIGNRALIHRGVRIPNESIIGPDVILTYDAVSLARGWGGAVWWAIDDDVSSIPLLFKNADDATVTLQSNGKIQLFFKYHTRPEWLLELMQKKKER